MTRKARRFKSEINVVPYIDVMLVLLIIFMVTAPMISPSQINLPDVGAGTSPTVAPMEIEINDKLQIRLKDRQAMTEEAIPDTADLVSRIRERQTHQPDQAVVIAADRNLRYEEVMKIMDALMQGGVQKIGLLAKPPTGG